LQQIAPLILSGPSGSPVIQMKMPRVTERRYDDTDFSLRWMLKDVRYALALAEKCGPRLKTAEATAAVYQRASEQGLNDLDFAAVAESLRE
jgi:3-hydroxyisobutyrate dehydrogenase-like beta-hydroxyacid dehydrogenase